MSGGAPRGGEIALKRFIVARVVPPLAALFIRLLRRTMRLSFVGREAVESIRKAGRPYIHAFWHGHLLLMPYSYAGDGISILISAHHDGELIARTMAWFGHQSIRGSTTSGGASALRAAVRTLRAGRDVGFTPDGPRGPRHEAQAGAVLAARLSGAPIVPVAFAASRRKVLGSWDGFVVPRPFSRGVFVYGEPITVDPEADDAAIERIRRALTGAMRELTRRAEALVAGAPVPSPSPRTGVAGE